MYILMFFSRCDMLFALELDVNNLIHVGTHLASFNLAWTFSYTG